MEEELSKQLFQQAIEKAKPKLEENIDDVVSDSVRTAYTEDAYFIYAELRSKKIKEYMLTWRPDERELANVNVVVDKSYRHQGVGSSLILFGEEVALNLAAQFKVKYIMPSNIEYWKSRKDYALNRYEAVKL